MEIDLKNYLQITPRFSYNRFSCLGQGNFGKVYKGWDAERRCEVAVKHLPLSTLGKTNGLQNREIKILKQLNHPNVLSFYGQHRTQREGLFLFLEFCSKGTLSDYLIKNRLTEVQALKLAKQLVSGMTYINDKQYFHRDLKPDNLLLTIDNQLKIADFGTARSVANENYMSTFQRCTPIYSAPEVYLLQQYNAIDGKYKINCDVFSAGYILYQMITGEQLTSGITTVSQLKAFLTKNKQRGGFKLNHPSLTPPWMKILEEMLDFNPLTRPNFKQVGEKMQKLLLNPGQLPVDRPITEQEKKQSNHILQSCQAMLNEKEKSNNYIINLLKILSEYQQEQTQLIPRVYKLLCLYLSLGRYCLVSNHDLAFLHKPENIIVDSYTIQKWGDKILPGDKKVLLQFIEVMGNRVNRGLEQIRGILIKQIIPELETILKLPSDDIERRVVEEYRLIEQFVNFRDEEYATHGEYCQKFDRCVNNLFKTRAETEILSDSDLKIYLTLLLLTKKGEKEKSKRPPATEIKKMSRQTLIRQISEVKNLFM